MKICKNLAKSDAINKKKKFTNVWCKAMKFKILKSLIDYKKNKGSHRGFKKCNCVAIYTIVIIFFIEIVNCTCVVTL